MIWLIVLIAVIGIIIVSAELIRLKKLDNKWQ